VIVKFFDCAVALGDHDVVLIVSVGVGVGVGVGAAACVTDIFLVTSTVEPFLAWSVIVALLEEVDVLAV